MVQHLLLGTSRYSREASKLLVAKSSESFGDVGRGRSRCVTQLVDEPKVTLDLRPLEQLIDAKLYRLRTLPRNNFPEVFPSGHAVDKASTKPRLRMRFWA